MTGEPAAAGSPAEAHGLYAHEVAPEVPELWGEEQELDPLALARYRLARAWGFLSGWQRGVGRLLDEEDQAVQRVWTDRLLLALAEQGQALLTYAVATAQADPLRWAELRNNEEGGEWLWQCGQQLGLDMASIKPYEVWLPAPEPSA